MWTQFLHCFVFVCIIIKINHLCLLSISLLHILNALFHTYTLYFYQMFAIFYHDYCLLICSVHTLWQSLLNLCFDCNMVLSLNKQSLLYGSQSITSKSSNHEILKFVIKYIKETARFDTLLFCPNQWFFWCFFSGINVLVFYRYISDINVLCSNHCKHMSLLNVESYVFINVFYLVLFCIRVCVDDVIKKKKENLCNFQT